MAGRGYQVGFYQAYEGVRDPEGRRRKAEKIAYVLKTFDAHSLATATCLDVGCSSGLITAELAPLFARTLGVEYEAEALRDAPRSAAASLLFARGDAMQLPLGDETVDVVICAQVYEHVPDDVRLVAELYRVLRPGGVMFFSGPNWLFPIEPHYFLPFLHWLPPRWADAYVRLFRRGDRYYERSRSLWGLRRLFARFHIHDVTVELLRSNPDLAISPRWARIVQRIPRWAWQAALPVLPNFNWILWKPDDAQRTA